MEPITALLAGVLGSQLIAKLLIALRIVRVASTAVTVGRTVAGAADSIKDRLELAKVLDRFSRDLTPHEKEVVTRNLAQSRQDLGGPME